jgi:two-component system response regulator YesN
MNTLLIVDDEHIEREALQYIIERNCSGIDQIVQAPNGREALRLAVEMKINILLLDIKMPGISGIEVAKTIKHLLPDCKIVILTAFDYFEYAHQALQIGVKDFILKPVANDVIIPLINSLVVELEQERESRQSHDEISVKLALATKSLEHQFITTLLYEADQLEQVKEYMSALQIEQLSGFTICASITAYMSQSDLEHAMRRQLIKIRCTNKIRELFEKHLFTCIPYEKGERLFLFVFDNNPNDETTDSHIQSICEELCENLRREVYVETSYVIGNRFDTIAKLRAAYQQVNWVSKHEFALRNRIIHYREVEQVHLQNNKYPSEKEQQLFDQLLEGKREAVLELMDEIFSSLTLIYDHLPMLKMKIYELMILSNRAVFPEGHPIDKPYGDPLTELWSAEHLSTIRSMFIEHFHALLDDIQMAKLDYDRAGTLIDKVCSYIDEHYMDELTLEEMSKLINYSPSYLSRVFKLSKQISFVDYITTIRLAKSYELLKNPIYTVKDVSLQVGFKDSNYFTRVFKKECGMTPTEYRDKKMR